ncbi:glycosyltransferase [Alkalibacterium thalassium]|uniref:Glycosyltransferase involved in cell wall bisynthesis n=1 Tax=Alkalibacterium thalassium TaxID=426701 RepID=A0A1G9BSS6_9LACT|nr:glycosyltransferase [Alkalibacterium thalassium]SDK42224.1 Glycosyltransferase involved in cell wall bisynthesis [Alkalibacterium thalassium]
MNKLIQTNRVVHIMSGFGGGISSFIKNKADALSDQGIVFDVITFDEVGADFRRSIEGTGGHIYKVSNPKQEGFKQFFYQVNAIMKKLPKDVLVHSHVNGIIALPFYLVAKKNRLSRFVIHAHTTSPLNSPNSKQDRIKRRLNKMMSKEKLSCGVKASENIFGKKAVARSSIVHIPNSIEPKRFLKESNPSQLKEEILRITDNRLIIGHVGRFKAVKNHPFMLDIIEELKNRKIHFLWFFAGDGLLKKTIETQVKERNLGDVVQFLGRRDDIENLFHMMDVVVLPSFDEGLPTVVIEAQASSTPCLLSDTITKECDLKLSIVKYLPIKSVDQWVKEIETFSPISVNKAEIKEKLVSMKFTNETSAQLYVKFLNREIKSYTI